MLAGVIGLGGFAAYVINTSKSAARDQVAHVKALADTTNQQLLAHQEEDRDMMDGIRDELREIKAMLAKALNNAKGPVQ